MAFLDAQARGFTLYAAIEPEIWPSMTPTAVWYKFAARAAQVDWRSVSYFCLAFSLAIVASKNMSIIISPSASTPGWLRTPRLLTLPLPRPRRLRNIIEHLTIRLQNFLFEGLQRRLGKLNQKAR